MTPLGHAVARHKPALPRLVTLFAALAFLLQTYAVQTHVHNFPFGPAGLVQVENIPPPSPLKTQDAADSANCRLCQQLGHAGSYVIPLLPEYLTALGLAFVASAFAQLPAPASAPLFNWQSRAPPRA